MVESSFWIGVFAPVDDRKIANVDLYWRGINFNSAFAPSIAANAISKFKQPGKDKSGAATRTGKSSLNIQESTTVGSGVSAVQSVDGANEKLICFTLEPRNRYPPA